MSQLDNDARVLMDDCLKRLPKPLPSTVDGRLHNLVKQHLMSDERLGRQTAAILLAWYQEGYLSGMDHPKTPPPPVT